MTMTTKTTTNALLSSTMIFYFSCLLLVLLLTTYYDGNPKLAANAFVMTSSSSLSLSLLPPSSSNTAIRKASSLSTSASSATTATNFFPELATNQVNNDVNDKNYEGRSNNNSQRSFISSIVATTTGAATSAAMLSSPLPAYARYILDDETGEYIEQIEQDGDWKTEWKSRYNLMSTMSKDEIFQAGRGAGNIDKKDLANESMKSRKRRALSNCRDKTILKKLDIDEKTCTKRVLDNDEEDIDFILN
jgi:hypothetical protein